MSQRRRRQKSASGQRILTRHPRLETLESRYMMAADVFPPVPDTVVIAEGESRELSNLIEFATALGEAGVTKFGSSTCPVCARQLALFGDGADFVPYVEVTNPDGSLNQAGIEIPSPQRDLHVRSVDGDAARTLRGD